MAAPPDRRAASETPAAIAATMLLAALAAFAVAGLLFIPYGTDPLSAYAFLFAEAFGSLRGFGFTLVQATPLILIAQGTVLAWRAGLGYVGFEGCFVLGAAAAAWLALGGTPDGFPYALPPALFFPAVLALSFAAGAVWAGMIGVLRVRFRGNEVLTSLMANYVAAFIVQYLVSGPMRQPGSLPQTPRLPRDTWLPYLIPEARTHAGILIALVASGLVAVLLRATPTGYEIIASGINARAARYGGIPVARRQMLAILLAGGLAALAGLGAVLGVQHRLMDGLAGGAGFVGIVVALLARLDPLAVVPAAILYGGLEVGGAAMQRDTGVPSAVVFILESLVVLFILGSGLLRGWRLPLPWSGRWRATSRKAAE
ncbi:MAG TPA: ABC transporter permease [Acetobacteraceae bacterium]|nr:ABC transporter permease [Acetobacteraceae bacterium]